MNLNRVEIAGGLTKDPVLQAVGQHRTSLLELSMALNSTRYDTTERTQVVKTTFVTVQCWGWAAEQVARMGLTKGDEVYVLGELDQTEVEKDGVKDRKTRVRASLIRQTRGRSTTAPPASGFGGPPAAPPPSYDDPPVGPPPPYEDDPGTPAFGSWGGP